MEEIVRVFKALGDETRLKILIILSRRGICAKGVAKHLDISEAAVSQHLKTLKEAGLIVGEKIGYYVQYNIQKSLLTDLVRFIEQMDSDKILNNCKLDINMPNECKLDCKAGKNKCCHRNLKKI